MLRYIKVRGQWIDTLQKQKEGYYYYMIKDNVLFYSEETDLDYVAGKLEDEKDEM